MCIAWSLSPFRSIWKNGADDNIEYYFTISGKKIHIHYKPDTRKLYKIHVKNPNTPNENIASLCDNEKPLTPSELKYLLKQTSNYPNHVKLFEFVIGTYDSNNTQNNHNLQMGGELDLGEADLN